MSETTLHICSICERVVPNPCSPDLSLPVEGLLPTEPLPVAPTKVVRAKAKVEVETRHFFCSTMKELVRLKLKPQEIRGYVTYKIFEGLYHGIRYEYPWGAKMEIGPDTIEEVFDGRPQLVLPVETPSWDDEVVSYDRNIAIWLQKAAAGEIEEAPTGWHQKLVFIRMAMDTPELDPHDLD